MRLMHNNRHARFSGREDTVHTIILECGSFRLVPFRVTDTHLVKALHADRRGNTASNCEAADPEQLVLEALRNQDDLGVSRWKLITDDGEFHGWAGFSPVKETSEISLNYCLSSAALNQDADLPKRLCTALTDWFFRETYFSHLVAVVRTDNRDMRHIVLGAGFDHRESRVIGGMQADLFQILSPSMQSYLMSA